jgi:low affinity Fe/Cu permease
MRHCLREETECERHSGSALFFTIRAPEQHVNLCDDEKRDSISIREGRKNYIMARRTQGIGQALERFSVQVTEWAGSTWAFIIALATTIVWAATGPIFHYSDAWQLIINTGTNIATFLMVFLIQRSQNKDGLAIHLKLNEIVAALDGASNRLIDVEDLTEEEIRTLHRYYEKLAEMAQRDERLTASHSIEEAEELHERKQVKRAGR